MNSTLGNSSTGGTSTDLPNPYTTFPNIMMFLTITGIIGAAVQGMAPKKLLKAVPQPILLLILYLIAGVLFRVSEPQAVDSAVRSVIDPVAIQTLFLPILMCSELFRLNTRAFFIVLNQLLLLVGPGVIVGATLTAIFPYVIMPSRPLFDWNLSMAFGGMLATTDPIAVIICVNEMAAPKRLAALVGGESLLNDGTSIVLVSLFLQLQSGEDVDTGNLILFIVNQLFFSVLFGMGMGILSLLFIRIVRNDSSTITTFVVIVPFLTFLVSTYWLNSSGVLSVIPLCIILNEYGRGLLIEHVERIERLFDHLAFIATGWLYALSGFLVGEIMAGSEITAVDWASLFVLYIWINLCRFAMIFLAYPILKRTGYGFSFRECLLLAFGGLRGAVGLTLGLLINSQLRPTQPRNGSLIEFFMAGSILLMVINAILTPVVLKKLKLDSKPNERLMEALKQKMAEDCVDTLEKVGVEYEVAQYLAFGTTDNEIKKSRRHFELNKSEPIQVQAGLVEHRLTQELVNLDVLIGQRKHLVRAQRQMYEQLLSRGLVSRAAWYLLDRAADAQLEVNSFHLDQYRFVITNATDSPRYKLAVRSQRGFYSRTIAGRLLWYLRELGNVDVDELMRQHFASRRRSATVNNENSHSAAAIGNDQEAGGGGGAFHTNHHPDPVVNRKSSQEGILRRLSASLLPQQQEDPNEMDNDYVMDYASDLEQQGGGDGGGRRKRRHSSTLQATIDAVADVEKEDLDEIYEGEEGNGCLPGLGDVSRNLGVPFTPEEWCYTFALASWGFVLAQKDTSRLVDEMFTVTPSLVAFSEERRALKVETSEGCTLPAKFLDAVAKYAPKILARVKRLHALSEAGNRLFGCVATLNTHGLIERAELKKLLRFAEKGLKRIRKCDFELQPPIEVGNQADKLHQNPNFFPFPQPPMTLLQQTEAEEEQEMAGRLVPIEENRRLPSMDMDLLFPPSDTRQSPLGTDLSGTHTPTTAIPPRGSTPSRVPTPEDTSARSSELGLTTAELPHGPPPPLSALRRLGTAQMVKPKTVVRRRIIRRVTNKPPPVPVPTSRKIERRQSFGEFDPLHHKLSDGTFKALFMRKTPQEAHEEETEEEVVEEETVTTEEPSFLFDTLGTQMDMSKLREALKLDDAELKRY